MWAYKYEKETEDGEVYWVTTITLKKAPIKQAEKMLQTIMDILSDGDYDPDEEECACPTWLE